MATLHSEEEKREAVRLLGGRGAVVGAAASYVVSRWTEEDRAVLERQLESKESWKSCVEGKLIRDFWILQLCEVLKLFNVRKTVKMIQSHKKAVGKVWKRFRKLLPNLDRVTVEGHDLSKTESLVEQLGYTDRLVWGLSTPLYKEALRHHYSSNPHHPEWYRHPKDVS